MILCGCSIDISQNSGTTSTLPSQVVSTPTNLPTETVRPPTLLSSPTATVTPIPAPARAQYTMNVVLDYAAKSVAVDETILYPNQSGHVLTDLILAVEPDLWPGCFTLNSINLDGTAVTNYKLDGQKLSFALPAVFQPGMTTTIKIQYSLLLPEIEPTNPNLSRPRIFGYTPNQINLTNWYPFVVPNIGGQWALHNPWYYGEHLVYDAADYVVNIKPANPAATPVIASSGALSPNGEWTRYTLTSGRTFAISASTEYQTASTLVDGVTVTSYYFPVYKNAGEAVLTAAAQAVQVYTQRFGPDSHQTLSAVIADFNDGMEFSAFYFLSKAEYNLYNGTPSQNYLIDLTGHETAHQWWFEQVADDQAMQPFLDEAMATYSERIFLESADPSLVPWYWAYRVDQNHPGGWVDTSIYNAGGQPQYMSAVYYNGAHFFEDLRARIGDPAFFAFLRDYLKQENGKIATLTDFFHILRQHTTVDFSDIVQKYFKNHY